MILVAMKTNEIFVSIQAIILSSETCYLHFVVWIKTCTVEFVYPVVSYLVLYLISQVSPPQVELQLSSALISIQQNLLVKNNGM